MTSKEQAYRRNQQYLLDEHPMTIMRNIVRDLSEPLWEDLRRLQRELAELQHKLAELRAGDRA
jgi:hypothetical protein